MAAVTTPRLRLNSRTVGAGPDVVLVHGLASNLAFWFPRVVALLAPHLRVTSYDLRGHGYSDMPPAGYTTADMADDLETLLDALGIRRAHVVGHSFGGAVALHFAAAHPERTRTLTLADARIHSLQPLPHHGEHGYWDGWRRNLEALGIELPPDLPQVAYSLVEELAREPGLDGVAPVFGPFLANVGKGRGGRRWRTLLTTTSALPDFADEAGLTRAAIAGVRVPVLAMYGQYSHCLPTLRELRTVVPALRPVVVPKVGHYHPVIRAAPFANRVRGFIARNERAQARRTRRGRR